MCMCPPSVWKTGFRRSKLYNQLVVERPLFANLLVGVDGCGVIEF
jgi:hypothetical protein